MLSTVLLSVWTLLYSYINTLFILRVAQSIGARCPVYYTLCIHIAFVMWTLASHRVTRSWLLDALPVHSTAALRFWPILMLKGLRKISCSLYMCDLARALLCTWLVQQLGWLKTGCWGHWMVSSLPAPRSKQPWPWFICRFQHYTYRLLVCIPAYPFLFTFSLHIFHLRIDRLRFQARGCKRRPNLGFLGVLIYFS